MIAPIAWRTPPRAYGPWEAVTSLLTEALVRRGHAVTLFATADSITSAALHPTAPAPYEEDEAVDAKVWEAIHVGAAMARAHEFDVLHNQADFPALPFARLVATPMVTTIHGLGPPHVQARVLPVWREYGGDVAYVSISDSDRHPDLPYAGTVHHGLDLDDWPFRDPGPDAPLLFFGRIHPDKGPDAAITVARAAGMPLVMAGIVHDAALFERAVAPHVDGEAVTWLGNVGGRDRARVLGSARALLHPIDFDEPFGLSVIEAMACGTPVIAYRRGSMPELIEDGVTGFLVDGPGEMRAAVARVPEIDRQACRARVAERFTADAMARGYEAIYERVVGGEK